METRTYFPTVGRALFQTLADIWALIETKGTARTRGHQIAFCLLSYTILESWVARLAGPNGILDPKVRKQLQVYRGTDALREMVLELLVVRNAISHGHMYEEFQSWKEKSLPIQKRGSRVSGREDNQFKLHVNLTSLRTHRLKLHADPSAIDPSDCRKAARVLLRVMALLGRRGLVAPGQAGMSVWYPYLKHIRGDAKSISMQDLLMRVSQFRG